VGKERRDVRLLLLQSLITFYLLFAISPESRALSVTTLGQPVTGISSSEQAVLNCPGPAPGCYHAASGQINFFIPINPANTGVYGVVGVSADTNSGPFVNAEILTMYLRFSPIAPMPLSSASVELRYTDLDLSGGSDPLGFTETVRFYDSTGNALSPLISMLVGQSPGSIPFAVSGDATTQTIVFSDLKSVINGDPFWMEIRYGSAMTRSGTWTNTIESLTATLSTSTAQVPEPSALLQYSLGIMGFGVFWWRKRRSSNGRRLGNIG
jgi:hypothetical protein